MPPTYTTTNRKRKGRRFSKGALTSALRAGTPGNRVDPKSMKANRRANATLMRNQRQSKGRPAPQNAFVSAAYQTLNNAASGKRSTSAGFKQTFGFDAAKVSEFQRNWRKK